MWLGSSIGNLNRQEAAEFLTGFASVLGPKDFMMVAVDGCRDKDKVYHAYNDREGKTHEFVRNGLTHANKLLGRDAFKHEDWEVVGEYDVAAGRHQAFFVPVRDLKIDDVLFSAGERVRIEESYKYSSVQCEELWELAGLLQGAVYGDQTGQYSKFIFFRCYVGSSENVGRCCIVDLESRFVSSVIGAIGEVFNFSALADSSIDSIAISTPPLVATALNFLFMNI